MTYAGMLLAAAALFLLVRGYGETTAPPPSAASGRTAAAEAAGAPDVLFHVLLALAVVAAAGRLLGRLFARIRQPPVIGEVVAGIVLGPSLLGRLAAGVAAYVLPPSIAPPRNVVARLGIVLFMFLVGVELNVDRLRRHTRTTSRRRMRASSRRSSLDRRSR